MKKILALLISLLVFVACNNKINEKEKLAQIEKECAAKTQIDMLPVYFYGYFATDADSINVKIKRDGKIVDDFTVKIPVAITDSLRHLREYTITKSILLTDTVILTIKNEPSKKAYNFAYRVRPHYTMNKADYGCDFYQVTIDGKQVEGGTVIFTKKGFEILSENNYKDYYKVK